MSQYLNPEVKSFILFYQDLMKPESLHICDGSETEFNAMIDLMVASDSAKRLADGNVYVRSNPQDVARVEDRTFICSKKKEDAGPTNQWMAPEEMKAKLAAHLQNCMEGRVLYVIPFCMGPVGSKFSYYGIQLTDSPYVVANMYLMTRMGKYIMERINVNGKFVRCIHSVGLPLKGDIKDVPWPCSKDKYIVHYPEEDTICSYGSGYGGNALLGKKCLALRIASTMAKKEEWLAEHMLIISLTSPEGVKKHIAAAFPSSCGKTNLAMMKSSIKGWKLECIGDDIAWIRPGEGGDLYAVNPEYGFFGVVPGTSYKTNPYAMEMIQKNTIFTNVALASGDRVYWEGIDNPNSYDDIVTWKGKPYDKQTPAAHPNSRFTASIKSCPVVSKDFENPEGVKIDAFIFGGRREGLIPLVFETLNAQEGVLIGASLTSEMTAAAKGTVGKLRHDPFAMLPFCGYNMGDYFQHWLDMSQYLPPIFHVNWFRKDSDGEFMWPGFGDNIRVMEWIFQRLDHKVPGRNTPIGIVPRLDEFNTDGLDEKYIKNLSNLFFVDEQGYIKFFEELEEYFNSMDFEGRFPEKLLALLKEFKKRIKHGERIRPGE